MVHVKLSIIIPIYNSESYLEKCLRSVANQTLKEIEIFCIDDGSTDKSWDIVQEFAKRDQRLLSLRQENAGAYAARNKGIAMARGEYIGFVDSDDWVDGDYFEKLYRTAMSKRADVVRAYVETFGDEKSMTQSFGVSAKEYDNLYNMQQKDAISHSKLNLRSALWVAIYKRSVMHKYNIGFPPGIKVGADELFNLKFGYVANKVVYVNSPTYYHRLVRDGSLMTSFNYSDEGLISRSLVLKYTVEFLNSKSDYDKAIYVERVTENILFLQKRIPSIDKTSTTRIVSKIISEAWAEVKYKQEILPAVKEVDASLASGLSTKRRLLWYLYKTSHTGVGRILAKGKAVAKKNLPKKVRIFFSKPRK